MKVIYTSKNLERRLEWCRLANYRVWWVCSSSYCWWATNQTSMPKFFWNFNVMPTITLINTNTVHIFCTDCNVVETRDTDSQCLPVLNGLPTVLTCIERMIFWQQFPQKNTEAVDIVLFGRKRIDILPVFRRNVSNSANRTFSPCHLIGIPLPVRQSEIRNLNNISQFTRVRLLTKTKT